MKPDLKRASLIVMLLWGLVAVAWADIYRYRDSEGRVYLTDKPMKGDVRLEKRYHFKAYPHGPRKPDSLVAMERRRRQLVPLIESAARSAHLRPELVQAIVRAESAFRTDVVSDKGAQGLMQLMPGTARRFGVSDPFDAMQNLRAGCRYLALLLETFNNDLRLAVAAYNAGETAVINYGNQVPPYPETRRYVEKVLAFYKAYRAASQLAER
jgi:soluble lytic murein transglycosylase-like protein